MNMSYLDTAIDNKVTLMWQLAVLGNNPLHSLSRLSFLKLSQTCSAVKQSRFTVCGASFILPQPTTSDGDDCSLEINETTNLPDNIPSWGAVADTAGALFIYPLESTLPLFVGSV